MIHLFRQLPHRLHRGQNLLLGGLGGGLGPLCLAVGFVSAFLAGLFACKAMVALVRKARLGWFALYCAIVAVLIFIIA